MSTFSIPLSSAASAAPLISAMSRWGKSAWGILSSLPRSSEPRNAQEVLSWARSLTATQPALAAELVAIASRSMD